MRFPSKYRLIAVLLSTVILSACNNSDKTETPQQTPIDNPLQTPIDNPQNDLTWQPNEFLSAARFKNYCQTPRTGTDVYTGRPYVDISGTSMHEKMWLRSWSNHTYLWYNEVVDKNPDSFSTVIKYFDQLKTTERTADNQLKDNFHFTQPTEDFMKRSQSGVVSGYGVVWSFVKRSSPRKLQIAYTQGNSQAENLGIKRGFELKEIDGIDFINTTSQIEINKLNDAIFPSSLGKTHSFTFIDKNNNDKEHIIALTSEDIEVTPVQNVSIIERESSKIAYLQFNSFISAAQNSLVEAFSLFRDENISDLVIDLRYNGGGLLGMSSQLAYMVAGSGATNNLNFETSTFNDKHPKRNPITGEVLKPTPFLDKEINWLNGGFGDFLPSVDLPRVFVLTTNRTCSASEAFINGLRGIDIEVIQIGGSTCGKPYGFYPASNCGTTYYTIQLQGVNNKGFGDYVNGFSPVATPVFDSELPGCDISDDMTHSLSDTNEALLSAAIDYAETGECPEVTAAKPSLSEAVNSYDEMQFSDTRLESFFFENKINQPLPTSF